MPVKIQVRRGTAAQWTSANPTLLAGELAVELDTGKFKVGDGVTAWTSLAYSVPPPAASPAYQDVATQAGTTYTLAIGDEYDLISFTSSSPITVTVPTNATAAFTVGSRVDMLQRGTGQITVSAAGGVTLNSTALLKSRTQFSVISALKIATNEWVLVGDLAVI